MSLDFIYIYIYIMFFENNYMLPCDRYITDTHNETATQKMHFKSCF